MFSYLFLHMLCGPPLHMFDEVLIEVCGQRGCKGTRCSAWSCASRYWALGHCSADYTWSLTTTATIITAAVTAHVVWTLRRTSLTAANHKQCLSDLRNSYFYVQIHSFNVILPRTSKWAISQTARRWQSNTTKQATLSCIYGCGGILWAVQYTNIRLFAPFFI